ncbi:MAG: LPXTG cell wall anchor domain-containing protein [Ruminococcus sp.]|nr:LPXTG cell wall anchor domain-containing protein [Ruminococcus sp.]
MKKFRTAAVTVIAAAALSCAVSAPAAYAADPVNAYVTINNAKDGLKVTQEKIEVTDIDNDEKVTINDALIMAHDKFFEGGSAAGYATVESTYGPMVSKLWGVENGGAYGYYVNGNMASGPMDKIEEGAFLDAYVYADTTAYSDTYCFFDTREKEVNQGDKVTLKLSKITFDENFMPKAVPLADATVTVNGTDAGKTDADGNIEIEAAAGKNVVSAYAEAPAFLVAPVAVLNAPAAEAPTEPVTEAPTEAPTTAAETTTTTAAPTTAATTTTTATTAAATTAASTSSPKTGDNSGIVFAFLGAAAAAAAITFRKHED